MHCKHCGFANGGEDHRCLRCGRRLTVAAAAPYDGATALDLAPVEADPMAMAACASAGGGSATQTGFWAPDVHTGAQPIVRRAQKIIPFTEIQKQAGIRPAATANVERPVKPVARRSSRPVAEQENFDFVPTVAPRTLKDKVEAQVYCDLPIATPTHRFVAGGMDGAMILLGFGLFIVAANFMGRMLGVEELFGSGKILAEVLGAAFAAISVFYGAIWVIAGRETAGMKWSDLQLVTFDGFALDGSHRAARAFATVMSFCSGGLGLLWALADAENLTWHDQISRTFPTVKTRQQASFVKQPHRR
jgi:uncharacterized RDD family membrane protein YckC